MSQLSDFLPTTRKEMELRGWDEVDVVLFSGDAYVDHPSFGAAVIGRILEAEGLRVAIVPQPNWRDDLRDFRKMGRPRLFFGVTAGCMDSMVNKYTANKRLRSEDAYTPDGRHDLRPEYPSIVYTQILKQLYPDVPVVLGGIEASMRRLTHYDYWEDRVRRSILCDSGADILVYGMGEKPIVEIARRLQTHLNSPCEGGLEAPRCQHPLPYREGWGGSISSWANALIRRHGYITAEPYYNKVQDFAMEFYVQNGQCRFIGYSLFSTNDHGRYEESILMKDERIEELLEQYIPCVALHEVRDWVIEHITSIVPSEWDTEKFPLYFGIDMMVVKTTGNKQQTTDDGQQTRLVPVSETQVNLHFRSECSQSATTQLLTDNSQFPIFNSPFRIHPCVEINLRLNMGIIAHEVRQRILAPQAEGTFHVQAFPTPEMLKDFHQKQLTAHPATYKEGRVAAGYHPLTPILSDTKHHAYIIVRQQTTVNRQLTTDAV